MKGVKQRFRQSEKDSSHCLLRVSQSQCSKASGTVVRFLAYFKSVKVRPGYKGIKCHIFCCIG